MTSSCCERAASDLVAGLAGEKLPRIEPSVPRIGRWSDHARSERLLLFRPGGRPRRVYGCRTGATYSEVDVEPSPARAGEESRRPPAESHLAPVRHDRGWRRILSPRSG